MSWIPRKPVVMTKKELLKEIIVSSQNTKQTSLTKREINIPVNTQKVVALIGVRRSGKTYLLFDTINKLISGGTPKEDIVYINFEDERINYETNDLDLIIKAWQELYPTRDHTSLHLFFDEIQNIESWEKFIRRLYDTITKNIYITGSNSSFLSKDIATSLRGRSIQFEVFPFSFKEYLSHNKIETNYYDIQNRSLLINKFSEYLKFGGFPETINADERLHNEIIRNYFYVMLYKDLIERYNITSINVLKYFIEKLADNLTKTFSINKIYNDLKSQGYKLDKNLLYELIVYIENIYLAFKISKFDKSFATRNRADKKVYFVDNGLANILTIGLSSNNGKLLENAVFIFLRTKFGDIFNESIFYHKNTKECDFLLVDKHKVLTAIQVSYDVSSKQTLTRETEGLINAMEYYGLKTGYIITFDNEDEIIKKDKAIKILPGYKMMADDKLVF